MLDDLGIDGPSLLAFLINFFLLLGLLTFFLYKPITRMLDERSAKIKESLEKAERIKQEMGKLLFTGKAKYITWFVK